VSRPSSPSDRPRTTSRTTTGRSDRHGWLLKLHKVTSAANTFTAFLLRPWRRRLLESWYPLVHLIVYTLLVTAGWLLVWAFQWRLNPHWLVDSRAGMSTLLQVVPATVIALFVLVLGSVLVVGQLTVESYGPRAAALLVNDPRLRGLVVRALLVVPPALVLTGQVPDSGRPSDAGAAAASTIVLILTFDLILAAAAQLPATLLQYTAPQHFRDLVVADAEDDLRFGSTGFAAQAVSTMGDMLIRGVGRRDSAAVAAAVTGLRKLRTAALEAPESSLDHRAQDAVGNDDWLGRELCGALLGAAEESLRRGGPGDDLDAVSSELQAAASACVRRGRTPDARLLLRGIAELGARSRGSGGPGEVTLYAPPAEGLARVEADAEQCGARQLAADALAGWILVTSYAQQLFGPSRHPLWETSICDLGPEPPWEEARTIITSNEWKRRWASRLPSGVDSVLGTVGAARETHYHFRHPRSNGQTREKGVETPPATRESRRA
jgi:hypothetical protein